MATDASFILRMEEGIGYHSKQITLWVSRLNSLRQRRETKRYKKGSKELYRDLIEFYGTTKGKRMWTEHLRRRRKDELRIRRAIWYHRHERSEMKNSLAVYVK